eukprot:TRINITY_DN12439_c0_g1_i1.p1 TRINITY_DN12439_c0_g1~~TRINITY_DN12439_c0_g1_i1.p1  ORF type:complete len:1099 (+),score=421.81 TRINITY_DN12439_c0_g1_i1:26-3298(+)
MPVQGEAIPENDDAPAVAHPDIEMNIPPNIETEHTFTLDLADMINNRIISPEVDLDGHKWRLLVFPQGNSNMYFCCYCEARDVEHIKTAWMKDVSYEITLISSNPANTIKREANDVFRPQNKDWGFNNFATVSEFNKEQSGFLKDGRFQINLKIRVAQFISDTINYNSKVETGFVGLKNQGATCYMNSLLQSLFHIGEFRRAVYSMPTSVPSEGTNGETKRETIPLALQRVFYNLQTSQSSVGTKELTKSFGWTSSDAFTQHDVQELNRVLCDTLETQMKNTIVGGTIERLFMGKIKNYIQCVNVDYSSERLENYYDLGMNVKGCRDIYESLEQYVEVEMLDGDNKYNAEGYGLQDAKKGVLFESFPPILELQLKRFEYDPYKDANTKINQRFAFPVELDLSKYLKDEKDEGLTKYSLYGVLIHLGNVNMGHYYAYLRPDLNSNNWYKFDDEKVTRVSEKCAVDDNFGEDLAPGKRYQMTIKNSSNAYMLIYVRHNEKDKFMTKLSGDTIPESVKEVFVREREAKERAIREKIEAESYIEAKIVTEKLLADHDQEKCDLFDLDEADSIKIKKNLTLQDLKERILEKYGIPINKQRFWSVISRQNKTTRVSKPYTPEEEKKPVSELKVMNKVLRLFLEVSQVSDTKIVDGKEIATPPAEILPTIRASTAVGSIKDLMIFFKYYDPETSSLKYMGYSILPSDTHIRDLKPLLSKMANIQDSEFLIYEEMKPASLNPLQYANTLSQHELISGDIIVFQIKHEDDSDFNLPTINDWYKYINNRIMITFKNVDSANEFKLELSQKSTYKEIAKKAGEHLDKDPNHLRFLIDSNGMGTKRAIKYQDSDRKTLDDLFLTRNYLNNTVIASTVYYEILDVSIQEYENKRNIKVTWISGHVLPVSVHSILVNPDAKTADVIDKIASQVEIAKEKIRLVLVKGSRLHTLLGPDISIDKIADGFDIYAEETPADQTGELDEGDLLIRVSHTAEEGTSAKCHGIPFVFRIAKDESVESVKERIRQKLNVPQVEYQKWKFSVYPNWFTELDDDETLSSQFTQESSTLLLQHPDKSAGLKYRRQEKAIKFNIEETPNPETLDKN